ncbi:hypothetical protein, partial [Burkholderia vietnamiensis]|uniref:hypothetical protein n=1 Tax=Burkholderia vietnamiensis TaxID=60552 RepID=UPI0030C8C557
MTIARGAQVAKAAHARRIATRQPVKMRSAASATVRRVPHAMTIARAAQVAKAAHARHIATR